MLLASVILVLMVHSNSILSFTRDMTFDRDCSRCASDMSSENGTGRYVGRREGGIDSMGRWVVVQGLGG